MSARRELLLEDRPFLLFEGEDYYPLGGWEDFTGVYATLEEAQNAKSDHDYDGGWAHIVDLRTGSIVSFKNRLNPWSSKVVS
jgi:hypothetical protein